MAETSSEDQLKSLIDEAANPPASALAVEPRESQIRLASFNENQILERQGRLQVFELRATWSRYLILLLFATIAFQMVLAFGIGMGLFDYAGYETSLDIIVGSNFVQIVGLIAIALTFLFSEASRTSS